MTDPNMQAAAQVAAADLDLEVAAAAAAAARLAQDRTQRLLRRIALLTAVALVLLSAATLVYVVTAVSRATDAAEAATDASEAAAVAAEGNTRLLELVQAEAARQMEADQEDARRSALAVRGALAELEAARQRSDSVTTAQLQLILDLVVAEVRAPSNKERPTPRLADEQGAQSGHAHPQQSAQPRRSARPSPSPRPTPSPRPSCATGQPVLGLCVPPPAPEGYRRWQATQPAS